MSQKRSPCADCPWRKDAPKGYWHPDHFAAIWHNCQDDGMHTMQCHKSPEIEKAGGKPLLCAGYALVLNYNSIGLRIAGLKGEYDPANFTRRGIKLHRSFEDMMLAQGIEPPRRNRQTSR